MTFLVDKIDMWGFPKQANPVRFGTKYICFGIYVLPLSPLFARFYNTLQLVSFVLPDNHLLFLAKTNKENDKRIDFSLLIGQNLKN